MAVLALSLSFLVCVAGYLQWMPSIGPSSPEVGPALQASVLPIAAADPEGDARDLQPLLPLLGSKRVVALGEATHGTREFFRLKDRLFRFLVREAGFTAIAFEISPESAARVDAYVKHGLGSAQTAIGKFEFWTWRTEEVLALVEWMRAWNVAHPARPLAFVGINAPGPDRDARMAANVERALAGLGAQGRMVVWAHNAHVSTANGWMGQHLRKDLGDALYVVGFEFSSGAFRSRAFVGGTRDYVVSAASAGYYAADLARLGSPIVFLDFHQAARTPALADWLASPRLSREIDEFFYVTRVAERWHSQHVPWTGLYDAVLFVRRTAAARGL